MTLLSSLAKPFVPLLLSLWMVAALRSPAHAQSVPSAREVAHEQEAIRLSLRRDELLERNRAYVVPALGMGLGAITLVIGGVVFAQAWDGPTTTCNNVACESSGDYNVRMDRTGLVMMPLGAALVLINAPMFAVRMSRARRLTRVTHRLERLGEHVSLSLSGKGTAVYARLRF